MRISDWSSDVCSSDRRLFIVALRGDIEFKFPEPTRSKDTYKTVGEALAGLPKPVGKGEDTVVSNHIDVTPAGDKKRISYVEEGSFLAKRLKFPKIGRASCRERGCRYA